MPPLVYEADWKALGRSAGPIRNRQIVIGADHVVASWDELSRGTADVILASHLQGELAKVYGALWRIRAPEENPFAAHAEAG